jgi:hypothetical protein
MDDDDEDLNGFYFGSIQESELDPPLVLDSVWDCLGITLDKTVDDDGKTIPGWRCGYCSLTIVVVSDSSRTVMHLRLCHTLQRGRTLSLAASCGTFLQMLSMSQLH